MKLYVNNLFHSIGSGYSNMSFSPYFLCYKFNKIIGSLCLLQGGEHMAGLQLGEGAKLELLADLVIHERKKNVPEEEIF